MVPIILIIVGIILIALNFNAIRKEKKSFQGKLSVSQDEMKSFKLEIGKVRKEFAETILELQKEIEVLKTNNNRNFQEDTLSEKTSEEPKKNENSDKVTEEYANNVKIDEIRNLLKDDVSVNDISEKTGIGKGEVLLIKELYAK